PRSRGSRGVRSGVRSACPWLSLPSRLGAEAQRPDEEQRLRHDAPVHLGIARAALLEEDRHLHDAQPQAPAALGYLDLKGVAAGADLLQLQRRQRPAAEPLEAAGQVAEGEAEDQ